MLIKVILLALWFGVAYLWINRHFHSSWLGDLPSVLAAISVFSGILAYLIGFFFNESQRQGYRQRLAAKLSALLGYPTLSLAYLILLAAMLGLGTLTVLPPSDGKIRSFHLSPLHGSGDAIEVQELVKRRDVHLLLNPFANEYELRLTGYLPKVISVQPAFGTTLLVDRDLTPIPTLLFRPSLQGKRFLLNQGHLAIFRQDQDGNFQHHITLQGDHAWFSGPAREQPATLLEKWRLELIADNVPENSAANMMLTWRSPTIIKMGQDLLPGHVICALISNKDGKVYWAGMAYRITTHAYQDLFIKDLTDEHVEGQGQGLDPSAICRGLA